MSKGPAFSIEGILAWTVIAVIIPVYVASCICLCLVRGVEHHPYSTVAWFGIGSVVSLLMLMTLLAEYRLGGNRIQRIIDKVSKILFTLIFLIPAFLVTCYCWVRGKEPPHIVHISVGFVIFSVVLSGTLSVFFS